METCLEGKRPCFARAYAGSFNGHIAKANFRRGGCIISFFQNIVKRLSDFRQSIPGAETLELETLAPEAQVPAPEALRRKRGDAKTADGMDDVGYAAADVMVSTVTRTKASNNNQSSDAIQPVPYRMPLFASLVTACVALSLLSTALHTALAPLISDLGISLSQGQWVTSGYALVLAVMTPFTAFLSTRFRTRPLYLAALGCFLTGTVLSALAPTFAALMVGRFFQASANALIANITQVTIMNLFPTNQRGQAMGWFGLATGTAPIAAPALGGFVTDLWGWRMVFWAVGALCLVGFAGALLFMRNTIDAKPKPFDGVSFFLSIAAFGGIMLGLGNIASCGMAAPVVWAPLLLGVCAGVPFALRQLKAPQPFLNVRVLAVPAFRCAVVSSMLLYAAMMGASAVLPLFIQGQLGYSATVSGLVVLPGAIASAIASPLAGRAFDRWGIRALLLWAGAVGAVASAVLCIPAVCEDLVAVTACNVLRCAAIGCLTMPLTTWGNGAVARQDMPAASALLTSFRNMAGALGVAIFVGILDVAGSLICFAALAACAVLVAFCAAFARDSRMS